MKKATHRLIQWCIGNGEGHRIGPSMTGFVASMCFLAALTGCVADNSVPQKEAQARVNNATFAHQEVCDQPKRILVPIPHDVRESDLQQCEGELLSGGCPMSDEIPPSCWVAVLKDAPADQDGR